MGNVCVRSAREAVAEDVKTRHPESEPAKKMNSDDVFVQVWKNGSDPTEFWLEDGLSKGSAISVGTSNKSNYFVWERNCQCPEPRWRFRSDNNEGLYITYDESDNLTMEPDDGGNSIFYANVGMRGGYIFQVPNTQKFIAEVQGKLILSDTPTEWSLDPSNQEQDLGIEAKSIFIIKEYLTGRNWMSASANPKPGDLVILDIDYQESPQAQWIGQFIVKEASWNFQPKQKPSVFVTCHVEKSEISLQTGSNENIKERLIGTNGYFSITMQDSSGEKYFYSKPLGDTYELSLTSDAAEKSEWNVYVYAFDIGGDVYPPDSNKLCGTKTENTEVPSTLSQEPAELEK